jgi:hypothetical protein
VKYFPVTGNSVSSSVVFRETPLYRVIFLKENPMKGMYKGRAGGLK